MNDVSCTRTRGSHVYSAVGTFQSEGASRFMTSFGHWQSFLTSYVSGRFQEDQVDKDSLLQSVTELLYHLTSTVIR